MVVIKQRTIGSDPEFIIVDSAGHIVSAEEVFGGCLDCDPCEKCDKEKCSGNRRKCGACEDCELDCDYCTVCDDCDSCRDNEPGEGDCNYCEDCMEDRGLDLDGEIGCDGCSVVGELRPLQGKTPNEHHNNILQLIKEIDIPNNLQIRAGTVVDGYAIGGHIHLGIPGLTLPVVSPLSVYLSKHAGTLLRKLELPEHLYIRGLCECGYGRYGSFNRTGYGIEWRMPASWLVSSEITLSALSLAHVVASEFIRSPEVLGIPSLESQKKTVASKHNIPRLITKVESMREYSAYREELEPLFQMLTNGERWNPSIDIRETWV